MKTVGHMRGKIYASTVVRITLIYREQLNFVKSLNLTEGEKKTLACPACGKRNKFTVDKFDGVLVWNCYSASCSVKGSFRGSRDMDALKNYIGGSPTQRHRRINRMPEVTTSVKNHAPALTYLRSVNSLEAYEQGYIKIRYAPSDNRVLFYTPDELGAVGRALDKRTPKWWSYGDTSSGIHVGSGNHCVLVEDAPSACSVSRIEGYTGVALLGTNVTQPIKKTLSKYTSCGIILDKDASSKAVLLTRQNKCINYVRFTANDLKLLSVEKVRDLIQ